MNRSAKAILSGVCLVLGFYVAILALRTLLVLGVILLPVVLFGVLVYFAGYGLPQLGEYGREAHHTAEVKARQLLDWADFNAPVWMWSSILGIRTFLDWLGLRVKKTA